MVTKRMNVSLNSIESLLNDVLSNLVVRAVITGLRLHLHFNIFTLWLKKFKILYAPVVERRQISQSFICKFTNGLIYFQYLLHPLQEKESVYWHY